jgi:hypothetical protein
VSIQFPAFPYNVVDKENDPGIFETAEMRLNPNMFKDKLIEGFKKSCPPGILKTFKTDDEIWDYIMQQGMWKVKEDISPSKHLPPGGVEVEHVDVPPFKGLSAIETSGEPISKTLNRFAEGHCIHPVPDEGVSGMIIGCPHQSIAKVLASDGLKNIAELSVGDSLIDSSNDKVFIIDSFTPASPPPVPEAPHFEGQPRNRAERRAAKKGGYKSDL